ncbi:MAG: hypothetical protein Phyf2KO_03150 [Phycisphaerales bacterium]
MSDQGSVTETRDCRKCGYDLRGLEPNPDCPECGALNLFLKPYRGIEIFAFTAKSGLKTMALLGLIFVGACVVVAIGIATRESPSTQLPNNDGLDSFDIGFLSVAAAGLIGSYLYTRILCLNSTLRISWDKQSIEAENCVHKRGWLPFKKKCAEYPMSQLRGYGHGSPFGIVVDLLRKRGHTSWTYFQFESVRVYIHDNTEDFELLVERVKDLLSGAGPACLRDELSGKTLPVWATGVFFVIAFVVLGLVAYLVWDTVGLIGS